MQSPYENYIEAFSRYLETGQTDSLQEYCHPNANLEFLAIYRNGSIRASVDALASNYPVVVNLLGQDSFREIAREYVSQYPPLNGSLVGYGERFPTFLKESKIGTQLPYIHALATLDRKWLEVYFGKETVPLAPENIIIALENQELGMELIALSLPSAVFKVNYAVSEIWQKIKSGEQLKEKFNLAKAPEYLLLWRDESGVMLRSLAKSEYFFLSKLREGLSLQQAAEQVLKQEPSFDLDIQLSNLLSAGLLTIDRAIDK